MSFCIISCVLLCVCFFVYAVFVRIKLMMMMMMIKRFVLSLFVFSCTVLFVSISQVIGCEDRLGNDLYCVVKLYSNQTKDKATTDSMFQIVEAHPHWPVFADVFEHPPPRLASRRPIWSDMTSVDTITQC